MGNKDVANYLKVGEKIRIFRKQKGLSQKELAAIMEMPASSLANYENGNRTPSITILQRIADVLECSINSLMGWVDETTPAQISDCTIDNILKNAPEEYIIRHQAELIDIIMKNMTKPSFHSILSEQEKQLLKSFRQLNETGQSKAIEQVSDLAKISDYRNE